MPSTTDKHRARWPGGWRPIESAPRDGMRILWCGDNGEFAKRRWSFDVVRWPQDADAFEDKEHCYWQPLPEPPAPEAPPP